MGGAEFQEWDDKVIREDWIEAKGYCGLSVGDEKVYCAYVNGVALFSFKDPNSGQNPYYVCVVTGHTPMAMDSLKVLQDLACAKAITSKREDRKMSLDKKEFDWLVNNPSRLPYSFGTFLKNGSPIKPSYKESLDRAKELTAQIDRLHQEIDDLLSPIVHEAMASGAEACAELLGELPEGFHRTEVKVFISKSQKRTAKQK